MEWEKVFDFFYKALTMLMSGATLVVLFKIGIQLGIWKEWVRTTDKELASLGTLNSGVQRDLDRLVGREEGRKEKE